MRWKSYIYFVDDNGKEEKVPEDMWDFPEVTEVYEEVDYKTKKRAWKMGFCRDRTVYDIDEWIKNIDCVQWCGPLEPPI